MSEVRRRSGLGAAFVQYFLLLVAESAWVYPWSVALAGGVTGSSEPVASLPLVLALLAAALLAARLAALAGGESVRARRALVAAGLAVACLMALSQGLPAAGGRAAGADPGMRALAGLALGGFLWWRGILLGGSRPSLSNVEDQFRTGIVALGTLLVLSAVAGASSALSAGDRTLAVLALVAAGLVGMPLARITDEGDRSRHREAHALAPGGPWLAMLLGVVAGITAVALLLAQLLSFDRMGSLLGALLGPLGAVLWAPLYLVAFLAGLVAGALIDLVRLLLGPGAVPLPPQPSGTAWMDDLRRQVESGGTSPEIATLLRVAMGVALGLVLALLLARAVSRLGDLWERDEVEELRDFVWSRPGLRALGRRMLARLRPARPGHRSGEEESGGSAAAAVRRAYREFLLLASRTGRPRRPPETPLEYEARLREDSSASGAGEIRSLTEGYLRARYASPASPLPDLPPLAAALARLRALWGG